jgi:uncharacterized protein with HEPN domain
MRRDYGLYIDDILEAVKNIEEYVSGLDYDEFTQDRKTVDAVLRNFKILGEAAKHVPERIRTRYPDVPWKAMAGMQDKLIHEYFGVRFDVIWETIKERLPELKRVITNVLEDMERRARES